MIQRHCQAHRGSRCFSCRATTSFYFFCGCLGTTRYNFHFWFCRLPHVGTRACICPHIPYISNVLHQQKMIFSNAFNASLFCFFSGNTQVLLQFESSTHRAVLDSHIHDRVCHGPWHTMSCDARQQMDQVYLPKDLSLSSDWLIQMFRNVMTFFESWCVRNFGIKCSIMV